MPVSVSGHGRILPLYLIGLSSHASNSVKSFPAVPGVSFIGLSSVLGCKSDVSLRSVIPFSAGIPSSQALAFYKESYLREVSPPNSFALGDVMNRPIGDFL